MLSRVADAVFWMSRYIERAESVARFVDVSLQLSLDRPEADAAQWSALVAAAGDDEAFRALHGEATREAVLAFLTFDAAHPSSIVSCLRHARENARSVREIISSEMWEELNKSYLMVGDAARAPMDEPHAFYASVKRASATFVGLMHITMTHGEAWHFGRLGRLLERADTATRILDVKSFLLTPATATQDESQWAALLRSASALEMYRKRHGAIEPSRVVDFLMLEREFPRSVLHCLGKSVQSLHAIAGTPFGASSSEAERALGRLHAQFEYERTSDLLAYGLHAYIDDFQQKLNAVGVAIGDTFFAPAIAADVQPLAEQQQQQQQ